MSRVEGLETGLLLDAGNGVLLEGDLTVPPGAVALVVFAHGSGSSRRSARNRLVAEALRGRGLGTLLLDLLRSAEGEEDAIWLHLRFDTPLLGNRLSEVLGWLRRAGPCRELPLGLFGASTGASAALLAAARHPGEVFAVVSRGGRPDLAKNSLDAVRAPTLLIVGGEDPTVRLLNEAALGRLGGPRRLVVVPGATHLFEEPGALDEVARLAGDWFVEQLPVQGAVRPVVRAEGARGISP